MTIEATRVYAAAQRIQNLSRDLMGSAAMGSVAVDDAPAMSFQEVLKQQLRKTGESVVVGENAMGDLLLGEGHPVHTAMALQDASQQVELTAATLERFLKMVEEINRMGI